MRQGRRTAGGRGVGDGACGRDGRVRGGGARPSYGKKTAPGVKMTLPGVTLGLSMTPCGGGFERANPGHCRLIRPEWKGCWFWHGPAGQPPFPATPPGCAWRWVGGVACRVDTHCAHGTHAAEHIESRRYKCNLNGRSAVQFDPGRSYELRTRKNKRRENEEGY